MATINPLEPSKFSSQPPAPPSNLQRTRGRVFDVMRPGKAPASPTSRPVVIGHKSAAQAAQITVSGVGERPAPLMDAHDKTTVQPAPQPHTLSPSEAPGTPPDAPAATDAMPFVPPSPAQEPVSKPMPLAIIETPDPVSPSRELTPQDDKKLAEAAAEPDTSNLPPAAPATSPTPELTLEPSSEDPVNNAAAPSLERQPVVVSHHLREPGSVWRIIALTLLALLFVAIVLDILMDAGLITIGIPHTHFFGVQHL